MKATRYLSILFGPLLCNVLCETNDTLHSKNANIDHVHKFENNPLFHNENNSFARADRDEVLVEENGDSDLSLEDDSTLRSSSELEESFGESDEVIVGENIETNEGFSEIFSDEDSADFLKQVQTKTELRDFIKNKGKDKPKFNKYTRFNAVKEIFPLKKKSCHNDKILSEEVSEKDKSNKERSVEEVPDEEEWFSNENVPSQEQGTLLKSTRNSTVNLFVCRMENEKDSVIVHGARAWTFETQDVNLTLAYPLAQTHALDRQYIITGFSVLLVTDGIDSRGYINSGGVLSDNISLSFISPRISSLHYEFQVYGIPRYSVIDVDLLNTLFYLCS